MFIECIKKRKNFSLDIIGAFEVHCGQKWGIVGNLKKARIPDYSDLLAIICLAITLKRNAVPSFKGQYEHSVDNKGRVAFPAKLRKLVSPDAQDHFTLLRGLEPCLYLYPQDRWEQVENRLSEINSFSLKGRTVIRNFLRYAEDLTLDKQNRLSLPTHLMNYSGIDSTAIFIGAGDRIEVWSPGKLDEADSDLSLEYYQELFEQVMGDEFEKGD